MAVRSVVSEKRYVDRFFGCLAEHARPCEANFFLCLAQYIVAIVAEQYLGKEEIQLNSFSFRRWLTHNGESRDKSVAERKFFHLRQRLS